MQKTILKAELILCENGKIKGISGVIVGEKHPLPQCLC